MKRQGFGSLVIIFVIVLAALVIGGIWYYKTSQLSTNQNAPQQTQDGSLNSTSSVGSTKIAVVSSTTLSPDSKTYTYANSSYGLGFQYRASGDITPDANNFPYFESGNFLDNGGISLVQYRIGTDPFGMFVDPNIANASSCYQFGRPAGDQTSPVSFQNIAGNRYSQIHGGTATMGGSVNIYQLHTFKNGFCYEFDFEISEPPYSINGSPIPNPSQVEQGHVSNIFPNISFFTPAA